MPGARGFRPIQVREDAEVLAWRNALDVGSKEGRLLSKSYERAVSLVRQDFLHGEVVPVPQDPRFEGMTNLRCEDLAGHHRLLYTNVRVEEGTIVLLVAVVTHREYDRLFGVRRR